MRGFLILLLACLFFTTNPANSESAGNFIFLKNHKLFCFKKNNNAEEKKSTNLDKKYDEYKCSWCNPYERDIDLIPSRQEYVTGNSSYATLSGTYPTLDPSLTMPDAYIVKDGHLSTLEKLKSLPQTDENKLIEAQTFYDMHMWSDSKEALKGVVTKGANDLRYKIRRNEAITLTPNYSFFIQNLADEFDLHYHKFGLNLSKNIEGNKNIFAEYNVIIYTSGGTPKRNNVVNEFRSGIKSRPNKNWEYRADLGVKAFEFGGGMINTNSWLKYYFNDKFNLKAGYKRDNIEQSYTSAVGSNVDGVLTGRSADNKLYLEYEGKLPYKIYTYGRGTYGLIYSANMPTNQYFEGMIGAGKLLYNNPKNKWLNTVAFDIVSFNTGYQYNQLRIIYDKTGKLFGGYFSPSYFNATTGNLKVEGNIKKWHLKYGLKGFGGIQTSMSPDSTTPTWGFSPYISYDLNDNISLNLTYNHFTYADIIRDQFIVNAVIRGFKKNAKN